jgi:hypothetical protein
VWTLPAFSHVRHFFIRLQCSGCIVGKWEVTRFWGLCPLQKR